MKQIIDKETLHQLHREGLLDEAKAGYSALLRINSRDAEALHALGIINTQQHHYPEAIQYLEKAIKIQPKDPAIQLHLANVLKVQGKYLQAAEILEKTAANHSNYPPVFNNLGTVYYAQGKLDNAIKAYYKAISIFSGYMDAYYNLGLALVKKNRLEEAVNVYQKILVQTPDHLAARFHLASTYMLQEKIAAALKEFLAIETAQPHHFETQTNLASCYLKQGALNEAKAHYLKALELHPEDSQILFNLGVINMQQGNIDSAIQYYQKTLRINPDSFAAQNNIGVAFLAKQHPNYALQHFKEALRIQPHNKAVAYTIEMLSQNQQLLTAPPDYIQSLFDSYASHYESHLLNALDYKIPELFKAQFNKLRTNKALDILDLGCGTGLLGGCFKPYAKTLIGIDLSKNMLEIAMGKKIYDDLVQSDLTEYLADKHNQYDLIVSGDVLVYIGDIDAIFKLVYESLHEKGFFIFNTEISEVEDYKMNQSGRFSHSKTYLDTLIEKYHFTTIHSEVSITRMQNNAPVHGHVYVLQKKSLKHKT